MARHIMAVCVVCLLCADRVPCEQHLMATAQAITLTSAAAAASAGSPGQQQSFRFHTPTPLGGGGGGAAAGGEVKEKYWNARVYKRATVAASEASEAPASATETGDFMDQQRARESTKLRARSRRHSHAHTHEEGASDGGNGSGGDGICWQPEITRYYLARLFDQCRSETGTSASTAGATTPMPATALATLDRAQFHSLLKRAGMLRLLGPTLNSNNNTCLSDAALLQQLVRPNPHQQHHHHHDDDDDEEHAVTAAPTNETTNKCPLGLNAAAPCPTTADVGGGGAPNKPPPTNSSAAAAAALQATAAYTLSQQDMLNVCPVLLYHLLIDTTPPSAADKAGVVVANAAARAGCIDAATMAEIERRKVEREHERLHGRAEEETKEDEILYVWIYSFASVFACSLLGLVGVAIIPFMDSRYYKHILQFLVSLAVGTMTGDAVLHLLPHSLAGQSERQMILKGLTCMGGIVFFYATEHGLTMIAEWRKRVARMAPSNGRQPVLVVRDNSGDSLGRGGASGGAEGGCGGGDSRALSASSAGGGGSLRDGCGPDSIGANSIGDKVCKARYSSYPYCYDEITHDAPPNDYTWLHQPYTVDAAAAAATATGAPGTRSAEAGSNGPLMLPASKRNGKLEAATLGRGDYAAQAQSLLNASMDYAPLNELTRSDTPSEGVVVVGVTTMLNGLNEKGLGGAAANSTAASASASPPTNSGSGSGSKETRTVIVREHESTHHGHSHTHGHVHSPPESLSSVAWMIIMGDGLHNFTDGMAIGAAFADNIAGGFSTSLAVFCHELPHELGDFAILIKAGMTVKSAVYYNLLTGVLSFVGMIVGIVFGQSQATAQWMFAAAAGLFIYIALVDMMPELSSAHKSLSQFALQLLGMISGVLVMLCIAIYEDDLLNVFATSAH